MKLFKAIHATEAEVIAGLKKLGEHFEPATREDVRAAHEDNENYTDGELMAMHHEEAAAKLGQSPMLTPAAKVAPGIPAYNLAEPDATTVKPSANPQIPQDEKTVGEQEFEETVPDPETKPASVPISTPIPVVLVKPKEPTKDESHKDAFGEKFEPGA
jgi:hypothetical protein